MAADDDDDDGGEKDEDEHCGKAGDAINKAIIASGISAIPFVVAVLGQLWTAWHSRKTAERRYARREGRSGERDTYTSVLALIFRLHILIPLMLSATSLFLTSFLVRKAPEGNLFREDFGLGSTIVIALTVAATGSWSVHGPLLTMPALIFGAEDARATGYALMNTLGQVRTAAKAQRECVDRCIITLVLVLTPTRE